MRGIESMKRSPKRNAEVEKLIHRGKEKGYLTYDEVNEHLPADLLSRDRMDDAMSMFGDMDIEIIDSAKKIKYQKQEDTETLEKGSRDKEQDKEQKTPTVGNAGDAVRLYLREMGRVNLLTREGEVELAKRIESGELQVREEALNTPLAVQEALLLAERIRSGQVRIKDILKKFNEDVDKEEEEKIYQEEILSSLEKVTRLHQEGLKLRISLKRQRLSELQHKVKKTKIAENSSRISEHLMRIPFHARQIDRIVQKLRAHQMFTDT